MILKVNGQQMRMSMCIKMDLVKRKIKGIVVPFLFSASFILSITIILSCDQTPSVQLSYGKVSKAFDKRGSDNTETIVQM